MDEYEEPTYEPVDGETGLPTSFAPTNDMMKKALTPDTDFQKILLSIIPSRKYFADTAERGRARRLEGLMNSTPRGRVFRMFAWVIILWAKAKNKQAGRYVIGIDKAMKAMSNRERFEIFFAQNSQEILAKRDKAEVESVLKEKGAASMADLYLMNLERQMEKEENEPKTKGKTTG